MKIQFTKMHGAGNDYIYVNCLEKELDNPYELAIEMSKRHFSVGSDGLVMICSSKKADAKMRMFNADGSEGKMCGNAIRCVGKFLYDNRIIEKTELKIETLSGIKALTLFVEGGKVKTVTVDMGQAVFSPKSIPVNADNELIDALIKVGGIDYNVTCVSVGNPHCVVFTDEPIENFPVAEKGALFENNSLFPERINTEFVNVISPTELKMRVWERGSGETFACGTGACAIVSAAVKNKICPSGTDITVKLLGGELKIRCEADYRLFMTGAAIKAYEGIYEYENKT